MNTTNTRGAHPNDTPTSSWKHNKKEKIRLNLDLTPQVKERLRHLQDRTDSASLTEVIRRALALYEIAIAHLEKNGRIVLENKDGSTETLTIP